MSDWLILVENQADLAQYETPHKVMRARDYLNNPSLFAGRRPNIINLARSYAYQSEGYYASLLAEARRHRVAPTVQSMVELSRKSLYAHALPELDAALQKDIEAGARSVERLLVCFTRSNASGYDRFAKLLFDWFRTPVVEVAISNGARATIQALRIAPPHKLKGEERRFFLDALESHTSRRWTAPRTRAAAKWSLAVLIDPKEAMPPSEAASLKKFAAVAERMGVEVEPLYPNDLASLAEFDALFIRATTAIDNFTYRFARRAEQEGMPVIDDTGSMIRCTNKVYLKELLENDRIPAPRTEILDEKAVLKETLERLGAPLVLKAPDGSFSRSVHKVASLAEFEEKAKLLFKDTALILAQEFMPTDFDWRVGVLGGEPLYACQYRMARGHWQIMKHGPDGAISSGGTKTVAVEAAPPLVIETAVKAARLIGDGLYGIDLKENERGVFVIEINDNPNLDSDYEGAVLKDELWRRIIDWFAARLERRMGVSTKAAAGEMKAASR
ncbi:RimK family protein [Amphiplicatus metriothermophilus]|uniref:Glutathione synthase/RimK-type ligase, ATP-grasp superfamily n=1 Tax=Amphiplicatus metriothermophilus TaxID=1519374 RepID=A0A239PSV2_9PROT|nr:RimK family protein [Amphiplicatus metriothermophilus]MBB5519302.1 glutathione synthase/RimK-type ligase-like ATP-grasp enzyme [Amphiplicatus metriothermophilus]SNT73371.1 Glutathione synthase/RimK-type ligase, ATP-grasp superfamily [Amphiplicatus metriothermophilus]